MRLLIASSGITVQFRSYDDTVLVCLPHGLQRIRMGKELLEAQRKEDDLKLKRIAEERQREKNEDARAR